MAGMNHGENPTTSLITREPAPQPASTLLALPAEIRQMIITDTFPQQERINYHLPKSCKCNIFESFDLETERAIACGRHIVTAQKLTIASVAKSCLQIYQDMKAVEHKFYSQNTFHFTKLFHAIFWLQHLSPRNASSVHSLSIPLEADTLENRNYILTNLAPNLRSLTIDISSLIHPNFFLRENGPWLDRFISPHQRSIMEEGYDDWSFVLRLGQLETLNLTLESVRRVVKAIENEQIRTFEPFGDPGTNFMLINHIRKPMGRVDIFEFIILSLWKRRFEALVKLPREERTWEKFSEA
ncbi:hypothetical protein ONS95_005207 [Cadophora gregata]|uniref:uncharacterized protein n=1 Tax=Cadophora gregata TaxID=51156 RepID=UPI0026DC3D15|nr:uncharacterized protein ONS95_005207 [Cadophora gregata]KAK0104946.1 hypothetical protein ONS95_005207 [Cadophora gregata]KAK0114973.1 hypothetical protein ONS96_013447 [Cadophora gregata f. sp. sojae]